MDCGKANYQPVENFGQSRCNWHPGVSACRELFDTMDWLSIFKTKFEEQNHINGISLYIKLPSCLTLSDFSEYYNKAIRRNVELEYLDALQKEWIIYRRLMRQTPVIREIVVGAGAPAFFRSRNLQHLIDIIVKGSIIHPGHEFRIEGAFDTITTDQSKTLVASGFRTLSFDVQLEDCEVEKPTLEKVRISIENTRSAGFNSVHVNLIRQSALRDESVIETVVDQIIKLSPDGITFHYCTSDWSNSILELSNNPTCLITNENVPLDMKTKKLLNDSGYLDIGWNYFLTSSDPMYDAWKRGTLYQNLIGYTAQRTGIIIGLGTSSFSGAGNTFVQNEADLKNYFNCINAGNLAIQRGYFC